MKGYHQGSLIKPRLYSAAPCTPPQRRKSDFPSPRVTPNSPFRGVSKATGRLLLLLTAVCHVLPRFIKTLLGSSRGCLSTPCSNAEGHCRNYRRESPRRPSGTDLLARRACPWLSGAGRLSGAGGFGDGGSSPSEPATAPQCSPLPRRCGTQPKPGAGEGRSFPCREPTGQHFCKENQ